MTSDTVRAGTVTFHVNNTGQVTHGLYVRGEGVDKGTRDIQARQAESLTLTLKPGTYEVFCPMSEGSHRQAGMTRKLVVSSADKPASLVRLQGAIRAERLSGQATITTARYPPNAARS